MRWIHTLNFCAAEYERFRLISDMIVPSVDRINVEYIPVRCIVISSSGSIEVIQKPIGLFASGAATQTTVKTEEPAEDLGPMDKSHNESTEVNHRNTSVDQEAFAMSTVRDFLNLACIDR